MLVLLVGEGEGRLRLGAGLRLRLGVGVGGISTFSDKPFEPIVLCTVSSLEILPSLPRKSMVAWIGPVAPDARFHGWAGMVASLQPHERCRLVTTSVSAEVFVA